MTDQTTQADFSALRGQRPGNRWILALATAIAALAFVADPGAQTVLLASGAATLLALLLLRGLVFLLRRFRDGPALRTVTEFMTADRSVAVLTDLDGAVLAVNGAAAAELDLRPGYGLTRGLGLVIADPGALVLRLRRRLEEGRRAEEAVVLSGGTGRISLHRIGSHRLLWRLDQPESEPSAATPELSAPTFMIGRHGAVLYMNAQARQVIGHRLRSLTEIAGEHPFADGQDRVIETADGPRRFRVAMVDGGAGRMEMVLLPARPPEPVAAPVLSGFNGLPVPILTLSPDGAILSANAEARQLLATESMEGQPLSAYMEGLGRPFDDWLEQVAADGAGRHSDFLRVGRLDEDTFVQVTTMGIRTDDGPQLVAVLTDATELKSLEAQFVQSQKMQAIGQLAGGIAHDFNNLLTAISGHCDLLLLRHDSGDPDYADLIQINQNANRAAALVSQLLAFSRKQNLHPELLDLRTTLSDLTHLLNRLVGEKIKLTLNHDPGLSQIRADKRQLEQVMMNLVVNARDAMPGGGEITVRTECLTLDEAWRRDRVTVPPGDYVRVTVTDQGVGIPADRLEKVFEPFFTTKRTGEGTGLGLSTVYGIVKQTGGFLFVDSVPGSGSTFTLMFRAQHAAKTVALPPPVETPQRPRVIRPGGGVVLLAEDEAPVRAFASRALRLRGFTVIEAASGEQALSALEDPGLVVDVIVSDVIMPGLNGPAWVRKALEARPDVRVVFMSGYAEDVFERGEDVVPGAVFLPKPFSLSELTDTVSAQVA
ncbi:ATP-binding protein [Mesobacterium sp. TK19101]|uniref:histidine kinase n=1 Tax=Mesobacterium hydrothermale TaxID=3111907 RepID=A0ABU6HL05_9RHOB|nr:ATP-binding protein [Mesobacterium sp. TK19101]MEC3862133.1 ATP-binding protein [Mesobacterium sp. TK19101]